MQTLTDPEQLLEYISNNLASLGALIELETAEVLVNANSRKLRILRPGESPEDINPEFHSETHYDRQIKYLKNAGKLLGVNVKGLASMFSSQPELQERLRELANEKLLMDICTALKLDTRCAREPILFRALAATAGACGYEELAENLKVEALWAAAIQIGFRRENPPLGNGAPKMDDPIDLAGQVREIDLEKLDDARHDLLLDVVFQLRKLDSTDQIKSFDFETLS